MTSASRKCVGNLKDYAVSSKPSFIFDLSFPIFLLHGQTLQVFFPVNKNLNLQHVCLNLVLHLFQWFQLLKDLKLLMCLIPLKINWIGRLLAWGTYSLIYLGVLWDYISRLGTSLFHLCKDVLHTDIRISLTFTEE